MAALRRMAAPHGAGAPRRARSRELPAHELVPGDVVLLEAGNVVPADLRLVEVARLRVAGGRAHRRIAAGGKGRRRRSPAEHLPLGDRRNMAFKGTAVTYGRAAGIGLVSPPA